VPPQFIRIYNSTDAVFDISGPVAIMTETGLPAIASGKLRRYYALRQGTMTMIKLRNLLRLQAFAVLQGYKLTLPSVEDLSLLLNGQNGPMCRGGQCDVMPFGEHINWHVWTSSPSGSPGSYWVIHAGNVTTEHQRKYAADETESKYVMLEVSEAFTVVAGDYKLTRMRIHEGMHCCFEQDGKALKNVPKELLGATFFELGGRHKDHKADSFMVVTEVDAVVYAIMALWSGSVETDAVGGWLTDEWEEVPTLEAETRVDPLLGGRSVSYDEMLRGHAALKKAPIPKPYWDSLQVEVDRFAAGFQLSPWRFAVRFWKRHIKAGNMLDIPFSEGLYGSIALKPFMLSA
jgi:hypothetical protein